MIADRTDVAAMVKQRHTEAASKLLPMARLLAGAAPVMDKLQRTEEWNRYASYLTGIIQQFHERKKVAQDKLGDPSIVKDEEIRKLRQDIFTADVSMDTLRFALELPAMVLKGKEEADKFIQDFEKKNETAESSAKP